jgi:hypothetical protein
MRKAPGDIWEDHIIENTFEEHQHQHEGCRSFSKRWSGECSPLRSDMSMEKLIVLHCHFAWGGVKLGTWHNVWKEAYGLDSVINTVKMRFWDYET